MDEYERGAENYTEAIRINPNYSEAYHNRAVMYHRLGLYEESEQDLAKVAELKVESGGDSTGGNGSSQ
jgi:tetratricopeptide (TPR) repeat protein